MALCVWFVDVIKSVTEPIETAIAMKKKENFVSRIASNWNFNMN